MERFNSGERVKIKIGEESVVGTVLFASGNGRSLLLNFNAMLSGYVMRMPVLWLPEQQKYVEVLKGREVKLERTEESVTDK